jgi:hypothetical protein
MTCGGYCQVPVPGAGAAGGGEGGEPGPRTHHLGRHAPHHQQVRHHVSLLNGNGWLSWWGWVAKLVGWVAKLVGMGG